MKNVLYTIYDSLIEWAKIIAEYRQSSASKHYY